MFKYYRILTYSSIICLTFYTEISGEILSIELKNKKLFRVHPYIYNRFVSIVKSILQQFHIINSLHLWQILAKHRKR